MKEVFCSLPREKQASFAQTLTASLKRDSLLQTIGLTLNCLLDNSQDVSHELTSKFQTQSRELARPSAKKVKLVTSCGRGVG
jgi:hypothetical protein